MVANSPTPGVVKLYVLMDGGALATDEIKAAVLAACNADTVRPLTDQVFVEDAEPVEYGNSNSRTSIEMNDPNSRPAISGSVENMEQYDVVFIGYPIWWGQAPKIISMFLESYAWGGKTIVPFCTSGSSSIGSSATNLESLTSGADWLPGRRFSGGASQEEMLAWADSLNIDFN